MINNARQTAPSQSQGKKALKVAINILNKWQCSEQEKQAILGISRSTLHKYQGNPDSARMTPDLLERTSYLLNIHQSLKMLFDNDENVYGFVRYPNDNYYFNGSAPMDMMRSGLSSSLYEVNRQLDSLRGGQW